MSLCAGVGYDAAIWSTTSSGYPSYSGKSASVGRKAEYTDAVAVLQRDLRWCAREVRVTGCHAQLDHGAVGKEGVVGVADKIVGGCLPVRRHHPSMRRPYHLETARCLLRNEVEVERRVAEVVGQARRLRIDTAEDESGVRIDMGDVA